MENSLRQDIQKNLTSLQKVESLLTHLIQGLPNVKKLFLAMQEDENDSSNANQME